MSPPRTGARRRIGALVLDVPRLLGHLAMPSGWTTFGNRRDALRVPPSGHGAYCDDTPWSSDLHVCRVFPPLGTLLMRRALADWPITLSSRPLQARDPEISFVVPFRGRERLPMLRATLDSIRAQEGVAVECVVVEQAPARTGEALGGDIHHVHLPHPTDGEGWRKAWAFNVGVAAARAPVVVCHDADILAPAAYAREALRLLAMGFDAAHLGRFLFYLGRSDTARALDARALDRRARPESVKQGWAGGTIVIRRSAYAEIGGFDEAFVGWGGEDNEFFDRCRTLRFWRYAHLPFVHLWHSDQGEKIDLAAREAMHERLERALRADRHSRIEELRTRQALGAGRTRDPG